MARRSSLFAALMAAALFTGTTGTARAQCPGQSHWAPDCNNPAITVSGATGIVNVFRRRGAARGARWRVQARTPAEGANLFRPVSLGESFPAPRVRSHPCRAARRRALPIAPA